MWTLVLFTLYGNPNSEVGMSANVTILEHFTNQKFCLDAEKALAAQGVFGNSTQTSYHIFGKCFQRQ
jgi:hypothetical protein